MAETRWEISDPRCNVTTPHTCLNCRIACMKTRTCDIWHQYVSDHMDNNTRHPECPVRMVEA